MKISFTDTEHLLPLRLRHIGDDFSCEGTMAGVVIRYSHLLPGGKRRNTEQIVSREDYLLLQENRKQRGLPPAPMELSGGWR